MFEAVGAIVDKLFYFGIGIYLVILSYKNKEKLGNKVTLIRIGGICLIIVGILSTIKYFFVVILAFALSGLIYLFYHTLISNFKHGEQFIRKYGELYKKIGAKLSVTYLHGVKIKYRDKEIFYTPHSIKRLYSSKFNGAFLIKAPQLLISGEYEKIRGRYLCTEIRENKDLPNSPKKVRELLDQIIDKHESLYKRANRHKFFTGILYYIVLIILIGIFMVGFTIESVRALFQNDPNIFLYLGGAVVTLLIFVLTLKRFIFCIKNKN